MFAVALTLLLVSGPFVAEAQLAIGANVSLGLGAPGGSLPDPSQAQNPAQQLASGASAVQAAAGALTSGGGGGDPTAQLQQGAQVAQAVGQQFAQQAASQSQEAGQQAVGWQPFNVSQYQQNAPNLSGFGGGFPAGPPQGGANPVPNVPQFDGSQGQPGGNFNASQFQPGGNFNASQFQPGGSFNASQFQPGGNFNASQFQPGGRFPPHHGRFGGDGKFNASQFQPGGNFNASQFQPGGRFPHHHGRFGGDGKFNASQFQNANGSVSFHGFGRRDGDFAQNKNRGNSAEKQ